MNVNLLHFTMTTSKVTTTISDSLKVLNCLRQQSIEIKLLKKLNPMTAQKIQTNNINKWGEMVS